MEMTNEAMVELFQNLTEMNQDQAKQIAKMITHIEALTNLLAQNGTRASPQEEENVED